MNLNARSAETAKPKGPRSRLYIFAVTAIAVFLVSLMVRRPLPIAYEVESSLRHEVTGNPSAAKQLAIDPTDELASYLAGAADSAVTSGKSNYPLTVTVSEVEGTPSGRLIVARYRDGSSSSAATQLDHAMQMYAEAHNRPDHRADIEAERAGYATNVQFWQSRIESIRGELEQYVRQELDRQRLRIENEQAAARPPSPETVTSVESPSKPTASQVPSLRWESLNRQFHEAEARLQGLLEKYTEAHPLVMEARRVAAAYQRELKRTPRYAGNNVTIPSQDNNVASGLEAANRVPGSIANSTIPKRPQAAPARFDEALARREILATSVATKLQESLRDATSKLREAEQQLQSVPLPESAIAEAAFIEMPATKVATLRAPIDARFLWNMIVPSLLLGVAVCIPRYRVTTPETLFSIEDVKQSLKVPVRGELATEDGPLTVRPRENTVPTAIRRLVTACEFSIAATAVLLLVCVLTSPDFVSDAVRDPINAIGSTLERLGICR